MANASASERFLQHEAVFNVECGNEFITFFVYFTKVYLNYCIIYTVYDIIYITIIWQLTFSDLLDASDIIGEIADIAVGCYPDKKANETGN